MTTAMSELQPSSPPTTECWCSHSLPNGTKGHWFSVDQAGLFVCSDPSCPAHGHIVYQCPIHRDTV